MKCANALVTIEVMNSEVPLSILLMQLQEEVTQ